MIGNLWNIIKCYIKNLIRYCGYLKNIMCKLVLILNLKENEFFWINNKGFR